MKSAPSCTACPFMRYEGNSMRCYFNPPVGQVMGTVPSKITGAPPIVIVMGVTPEVHPDRFCSHHPDLRDDGALRAMPLAEPAVRVVGPRCEFSDEWDEENSCMRVRRASLA